MGPGRRQQGAGDAVFADFSSSYLEFGFLSHSLSYVILSVTVLIFYNKMGFLRRKKNCIQNKKKCVNFREHFWKKMLRPICSFSASSSLFHLSIQNVRLAAGSPLAPSLATFTLEPVTWPWLRRRMMHMGLALPSGCLRRRWAFISLAGWGGGKEAVPVWESQGTIYRSLPLSPRSLGHIYGGLTGFPEGALQELSLN